MRLHANQSENRSIVIREIGRRPPGVEVVMLEATGETVAFLDGRELFRLSNAQMVSANEVVIDWRDLNKPPLLGKVAE